MTDSPNLAEIKPEDIVLDNALPQWRYPIALTNIRGDWLALDIVARGTGVDLSTVNRWISEGKLEAYKFPNGRVAIQRTDLIDFLAPVKIAPKKARA